MKSLVSSLLFFYSISLPSQIDSSLLVSTPPDTSDTKLNMDALQQRPFLKFSKIPISFGGYVEMNYQHMGNDGISDGHEFQFRKLSLFTASTISNKIKFLSELEYEYNKSELLEGHSPEVNVEYAALDIELHPFLNIRSGIILNPIGSFNQNHDGPKWEFTERPLSSTQMLPGTFSNAGMGIYGKKYRKNWYWGYEIYLTNGFDNSIIDNDKNKTYLPESKEHLARLTTSNSGSPMITSKIAIRQKNLGEIGLSYMGGIYNKWQSDGTIIDDKRKVTVFALDYNNTLPFTGTRISTEWAMILTDIPQGYSEFYGSRQFGGFIDIVQPIIKKKLFGYDAAAILVSLRAEYVDWNCGQFKNTNVLKGDDVWSFTGSISFRPTPLTVIRANYRYLENRDLFANPATHTGGVSLGISSYF